jgi:CoA:oxalate CoA-transferase
VKKLSERLQTEGRDHWLPRLRSARIPCAPVNDIAQVMADPQIAARNMMIDVEHSQGGTVRMPGNPIKLSETYEDVFTSPPRLGEHTRSVLEELLGKTPAEVEGLASRGVVG